MKVKHEICGMRILLVAATEFEIAPFIAANDNFKVLITGVGTPSTLYHLQKHIHKYKYDVIIQAGIAGSFSNALQPGQTALVKQDCFADLGFEENQNYTPLFETGFANKDEFPFTNGWLVNNNDSFFAFDLPTAKAITVNKVSDSLLQKQQFIKNFDADIETMEGAALHYVCLQENIPFLQIRSISNYVGERDKTKWKMKEAVTNLNEALSTLIKKITK